MNEAPSARIGRGARHQTGALRLHRIESLHCRFIKDADQVDHCIRTLDRGTHRSFVANIRLHRSYLSDIAHRFEKQGRMRVAYSDADLMAFFRKQLDDLASNAAGAAKYGDQGHTRIPPKERCVTMPDRGKFRA